MDVFTVSRLNATIKEVLQQQEIFFNIFVVGTITNLKRHSSGHYYFSIKDENASIDVALWQGTATKRNLVGKLENGLFVNMRASINFYEKTGRLSLICQDISVEQISPQQIAFEALKKELTALGYFDESHKQPIPKLSTCIGIVTSQSGAVLHDILQVGKQRNPLISCKLFAVPVQGASVGPTIAKGIQAAEADPDVDIIIVGRGGGSAEDLWCFNDRALVEAIYACKKPVISAVGHETDFTLCDFVADVRAATPTHAAELSVYPLMALQEELLSQQEQLERTMTNTLSAKKTQLQSILYGALGDSLVRTIHKEQEKIARYQYALDNHMTASIKEKQQALSFLAKQLEVLNPISLLTKGFTRTEKDGVTIRTISDVSPKDMLHMTLIDGTIISEVKEVIPHDNKY